MAALVLGTVAAMVVTQRVRSEGTVVSDIRMKTKPGDRYRACFRTPRDDTFEVALVNSEEETVRVLASGARLEGGEAYCFDWNGRDEASAPVPPGAYRLRLTRERDGLALVSGEKLHITAAPPP
ncbi:MAG TPA: hypothetical protein VHH72_05100 [Solirubrobacterales bacterium]|nr:hypothetical protein [Solirubrobacterales bacterium]